MNIYTEVHAGIWALMALVSFVSALAIMATHEPKKWVLVGVVTLFLITGFGTFSVMTDGANQCPEYGYKGYETNLDVVYTQEVEGEEYTFTREETFCIHNGELQGMIE